MDTASVNGVRIAYSRSGSGKPLVLIHGFPFDSSIWDEVVPLLEGSFDLIRPDVRGFGESTTVGTVYSITDMADDIAGLIDSMDLEKVVVAGHSMGGYVALAFAKKYPSRVSGLALISSQARADTPERREGRYKEAKEVEKNGTGFIVDGMIAKLSSNERVQNSLRNVMSKQKIPGVIGALKAMAEREDTTEMIAPIKYPLVLIHGGADVLIPIDRAQEIRAILPSSHMIELPGVCHMPMLESPEGTAKALKLLK